MFKPSKEKQERLISEAREIIIRSDNDESWLSG